MGEVHFNPLKYGNLGGAPGGKAQPIAASATATTARLRQRCRVRRASSPISPASTSAHSASAARLACPLPSSAAID
jgi:hypothetical protein